MMSDSAVVSPRSRSISNFGASRGGLHGRRPTGRLFYVGSTCDLARRLGEHASGECRASSALFGGDFELDRAEFLSNPQEARRREDELTVALAAEHGTARVYGAEFAALPRPAHEEALLLRRAAGPLLPLPPLRAPLPLPSPRPARGRRDDGGGGPFSRRRRSCSVPSSSGGTSRRGGRRGGCDV